MSLLHGTVQAVRGHVESVDEILDEEKDVTLNLDQFKRPELLDTMVDELVMCVLISGKPNRLDLMLVTEDLNTPRD